MSHSGIDLVTYFVLFSFSLTLNFMNYAPDTDLFTLKLKMYFLANIISQWFIRFLHLCA